MLSNILTLPWLLTAPQDFRTQCKLLSDGSAARVLATHALDVTQLGQLARMAKRLNTLQPLTPFRLVLLSNATVHFLAEPLTASALRHGLALEVIVPPFGQLLQQALDPTSETYRAKPDAVLIMLDHRFLNFHAMPANESSADKVVADAIQQLTALRQALRTHSDTTVIVSNIARSPASLFGSLDACVAWTERAVTDAFNRQLIHSLQGTTDLLLDAAGLAEMVGLALWHDMTQYFVAKLPFSMEAVPLYADFVARLIAALRGKAKKCLVLDLDNTLWGGIIGDDGLEGIEIGHGSAVGEAHLELQKAALALRARGVILAVCSKNDDTIARQAFREHPDMLLREEHIAVFQANWKDKVGNLHAIANSLSIGIDALVFVDDNPAERAHVRQALPEVAVPEMPRDPATYAATLMLAGYFEAIHFSEEDRQRATQYQANAERAELSSQATNLEAYLQSLDMVLTFSPFDEMGCARIAQLINKSNQFNLTTRRYTEAQVAAMPNDSSLFTLQVRLRDRFGDNGMISVVICRTKETDWEIDLWLMSCRVLKRNVEHAVLNEIMSAAQARKIALVRGVYVPTAKNGLVTRHYHDLGFNCSATEESGVTHWEIGVATYQSIEVPMLVERKNFH